LLEFFRWIPVNFLCFSVGTGRKSSEKSRKFSDGNTASIFQRFPVLSCRNRPVFFDLGVYPDDTKEKQRDTVYNANILLTQVDQHTYNLLSRNCEVLACFCRTGRWISEQVECVKQLLAKEIGERVKSWFETTIEPYSSSTSSNNSSNYQSFGCSTVDIMFGSFSGTIDASFASTKASCSLNSLKSGQSPANH
jgi:hypothetical protein